MIDPKNVCHYIPSGLSRFKNALFERIGTHITSAGGRVIKYDFQAVAKLPPEIIPIVGCMPEFTPIIAEWRKTGRQWIYWDRGFARRVFATWLPRGESGGYYRWHRNCFQLQTLRDVPPDRWDALKTDVKPWAKPGRHIVIAAGSLTYARFHGLKDWIDITVDTLARNTDRPIMIRGKESKRPLQADLEGAHALVSHGSIAAVEAAILGCPVFVHPDSAAALVGMTDLTKIESPVYPDRQRWLNSLGYSQFNERELVDGTLWRLMQ